MAFFFPSYHVQEKKILKILKVASVIFFQDGYVKADVVSPPPPPPSCELSFSFLFFLICFYCHVNFRQLGLTLDITRTIIMALVWDLFFFFFLNFLPKLSCEQKHLILLCLKYKRRRQDDKLDFFIPHSLPRFVAVAGKYCTLFQSRRKHSTSTQTHEI